MYMYCKWVERDKPQPLDEVLLTAFLHCFFYCDPTVIQEEIYTKVTQQISAMSPFETGSANNVEKYIYVEVHGENN